GPQPPRASLHGGPGDRDRHCDGRQLHAQQLADLPRPAPQGVGLRSRPAVVRFRLRYRRRSECLPGIVPVRTPGVLVAGRHRRRRHELRLELCGQRGTDVESALASGGPGTRVATAQPGESDLARLLQAAVLGAMALGIIATMLGPLHRMPLWMPRDENEGWNAYQALAALSGSLLYPPGNAFITNNYPPLSFYIVGALGRVLGDNLVAGRLIALLRELAVAGNIFLLVRILRGERFFALFSSLLFLLYIGANAQSYVAMDDPEWLAHAFVTGGAVLFLRAQSTWRPAVSLLLSGLLCVAGVLVKHNVIVLPFVVFLWALLNDRRQLLAWVAIGSILGAVSLLLMTDAYGVVFLTDVLGHKRGLSLHKLAGDSVRLLGPMTPLLLAAALLGAFAWRETSMRLVLTYALVGGAIGLWFLAGVGIDVNVLFDLI